MGSISDFTLVVQGGGARGVYAAGVLEALMRHGFWSNDVYGTSAGAILAMSYVSRDLGRNLALISALATGRHFVKPSSYVKRKGLFDFDYLLVSLPRVLPFNESAFYQNPCKFHVVATNCLSGEAAYFSKTDPDFLKGVAASASLPLAAAPIFIRGIPYLDGGTVMPIAFEKPLQENQPKIVVISTRAKGFRKKKLSKSEKRFAEFLYRDFPVWQRANGDSVFLYNHQMDNLDRLSESGRLFVFYPSHPPRVGHAERNKEKLHCLYSAGLLDAEALFPLLEKYLSH